MHPYLLHLGSFALPTYSVLAAVGLMLGILLNVKLAMRDGHNEDLLWNGSVVAVIGALIGAKLLRVINEGPRFLDPHQLFSLDFLQSAGVWYGGLLGGIAGGIWFMHRHRMPMLRVLDCYTPGIALGHAIGKLGCFFAGCCYGKPSNVPWAVVFTDASANRFTGVPLEIPLHPAQLYEFGVEMVLTLLTLWMWKRRSFRGQVIAAYLFLFGIARYFLEFYRDDPERGSMFGGMMSGTQFISILLVIAGGVLWMHHGGRQRQAALAS